MTENKSVEQFLAELVAVPATRYKYFSSNKPSAGEFGLTKDQLDEVDKLVNHHRKNDLMGHQIVTIVKFENIRSVGDEQRKTTIDINLVAHEENSQFKKPVIVKHRNVRTGEEHSYEGELEIDVTDCDHGGKDALKISLIATSDC